MSGLPKGFDIGATKPVPGKPLRTRPSKKEVKPPETKKSPIKRTALANANSNAEKMDASSKRQKVEGAPMVHTFLGTSSCPQFKEDEVRVWSL